MKEKFYIHLVGFGLILIGGEKTIPIFKRNIDQKVGEHQYDTPQRSYQTLQKS